MNSESEKSTSPLIGTGHAVFWNYSDAEPRCDRETVDGLIPSLRFREAPAGDKNSGFILSLHPLSICVRKLDNCVKFARRES